MNNFLAILMLLQCLNHSFGQQYNDLKSVVSISRNQIVYFGIDNPISIAIPGIGCENTSVAISQGTIRGSGCFYTYQPYKVGDARLFVIYRDSSNVTTIVDTLTLSVRHIPDPTAYWNHMNWKDDSINITVARKAFGIATRIDNFIFDFFVQPDHLTVLLTRNDSLIFKDTSFTGAFPPLTIESFQNLLDVGDVIRIEDIRVPMPDGTRRKLIPLKFVVYK